MHIDVISVFPELIERCMNSGVIGRALAQELFSFKAHDLRQFASNASGRVDDRPYGGGPGMVFCAEPVAQAIELCQQGSEQAHVIYLSAQGTRLEQRHVEQLAKREHLILLCGRYRGVDERVIEALVDDEYSMGDYIVSGGELPALLLADAVTRCLEGVLGNEASYGQDSFVAGMLDAPVYTRPAMWRGRMVPEVLRQGHQARLTAWRRQQRHERTLKRRPDLLASLPNNEAYAQGDGS